MNTGAIMANSGGEIWHRIIQPERYDLSRDAAESLLRLHFDASDLTRMHELTTRNQSDELTEGERAELWNYRQVGLQLDLIHSKARLALKQNGAGP